MNCCQCQGIEELFSEDYVAGELRKYHKKGPDKTTRMLIDGLKAGNVQGLTLLDIGGGVGAIQHELLHAGVEHATDVEASAAYLSAAQEEGKRRGYAERVTYEHSNFVDAAPQLAPADIVTLDRVICCYHDMERLVGLSVSKARKLYGLVYPRDTWWVKAVLAVQNLFFRVRRSPFRTFAHSSAAVEAIVTSNGFKRHFYRQTIAWQIVVFSR